MNQLPLSLVVVVSVTQIPAGIGEFNVNNVMLFTDDTPSSAPVNGFTPYLTPEAVADDYGSSSQTAKMASEIFAQSPNILAGGGTLFVAPLLLNLSGVTAIQKTTFSGTPASGAFKLKYNGNESTSIANTAAASDVQTALRTISGLGAVTVTGSFAAGFVTTFTGVNGPAVLMVTDVNTLETSGSVVITVTTVTTVPGIAAGSTEALLPAIERLQPLVSFCGVIKTDTYVTNELMDAATYVQSQNMILLVQSNTASDVAVTTGIFWQIMSAGLTQTRCLLYLLDTYQDAGLMAAAYTGRAFSTDFSGSNTTQNMQLKTLAGVEADGEMTLTIYNECQVAGVDVYPSVQGVAKVLASGSNRFFDQVYNQMWFATDIQVTVFNILAETPTKIPQTEQGMSQLKGGVQAVCDQGVANGYLAPGSWSGGTFGNQQDFLRNIAGVGYYIYSAPVALQAQTDRILRKAPLIQTAAKEAGAVDSASIQINIVA